MTFSWVNGTVKNIGKSGICNLAFSSRDTDLLKAFKTVPPTLPATTADIPPADTIDLAPGEEIQFHFLLPFDLAGNTPAFVGLADTLASCDDPKKKLVVPVEGEVADAVEDATTAVVGAVTNAATTPQGEIDPINSLDTQAATTSPAGSLSSSLSSAVVWGTVALASILTMLAYERV